MPPPPSAPPPPLYPLQVAAPAARSLLGAMAAAGVAPDERTFTAAIRCLGQVGGGEGREEGGGGRGGEGNKE